jgi:hypothetical protein
MLLRCQGLLWEHEDVASVKDFDNLSPGPCAHLCAVDFENSRAKTTGEPLCREFGMGQCIRRSIHGVPLVGDWLALMNIIA